MLAAMKHLVFSAPGTPLPERTVGELVAENPNLSRVFQQFKIDFCCQGARTVREACQLKEVEEAVVIQELENAQANHPTVDFNPAELPLDQLADYIVDRHHDFLRRELPRLNEMAAKVARVHGPGTPSLIQVYRIFGDLEAELVSHIAKEEMILFPAIHALVAGESGPMLDGPIAQMLHEHDIAGNALEELRNLTNGFVPPERSCNTYRALFAGLKELEEDLHRHIHLENAVLFPSAQALARGR